MEISFAKLHGAGNDFVMIDDMAEQIELTEEQVSRICDRHFGVGADGVILVRPSKRPECAAYMHYINSDGTLAQMCGNGVRCFAKFLVDREMVDVSAGEFIADTLAGPKPITFTVDEEGKLLTATVDMGEPILEPAEIPTTLRSGESQTDPILCSPVVVDGDMFSVTCVSMGNPHTITYVPDVDDAPVNTAGPLIEVASEFPEKTNVEFVHVTAVDHIDMRVWERGCGETFACGTGACATVVASCLTGQCGRNVHVHLLGGTLDIEWAPDNHVFLTGPAVQAYTGCLTI